MLYSLLYTTASLPMMLGPKAQALSYHVPTKYLFLPNSQAQSLEMPFIMHAALAVGLGACISVFSFVTKFILHAAFASELCRCLFNFVLSC